MRSFLARQSRSLLAWVGAVASAVALNACGGGSTHDTFVPSRVVAFGDENSVITSDGHKYTINALKTGTSTLDCVSNPIWVQSLAQSYRYAMQNCPSTNGDPQRGLIYAVAGQKTDDLSAQIDTFLAANSAFTGQDLVTVLIGQNDIIEQYEAYRGSSSATALPTDPAALTAVLATLGTKGATLATQVNRIARAGGKVIITTVPDLSLTPYARADATTNPAAPDRIPPLARTTVIRQLTDQFNSAMRVRLAELNNDGHMIGLVLADSLLRTMVNNLASYNLTNVTDAACNVALPNCTTPDMVTLSGASAAADPNTWLWADNLHLSPNGHLHLGAAAQTRAQDNPF